MWEMVRLPSVFIVVALAPLFTYRELRRADIPSTLRVME
jgi:hypothetical protein